MSVNDQSGTLDSGAAGISEEVVLLGGDNHLVGILSLPRTSPRASAHALTILNAGVLHRVGPHRLHVKLARQIAARGIPVLRIDLSGIGDSRSVPGDLTFRQSAVADARAAMDALDQRLGAQRHVIFGICSGADNGLATADADERVSALVLVDPPSYATVSSRFRKEMARVRRLKTPQDLIAWGSRRLESVRARLDASGRQAVNAVLGAHEGSAADQEQGRVVPPIDVHGAVLKRLIDRGVRVLSVFSGALYERYNHEDQVFEWFPELRGRLDRAYFPDANHTFTELSSQTRLLGTVVGWVDRLTC
jgi:dienelactone hydrolase